MARVAVALAMLLVLTVALFASAQGNGSLGLSPGRITIPDAQPGQTYHHTVTLQNQFDSPTQFTVKQEGAVGAWTIVDPGPQFTVPAHSNRAVAFAITPPEDTGPGNKTGQITFLAQVRGSTEQGVAVLLDVAVGGEPNVKVVWLAAQADNARVGDSLLANVTARNDGNVRSTARVGAIATALDGGPVLARGNGSVELDPGETGTAVVSLGSGFPIGQYRVHVASTDPSGYEADVDVKVTVSGEAPDGWLRAIHNPIRVPTGQPVTFLAWFENTGDVDIASARLSAQVLRDGEVQATLGSDGTAVPVGAHVNLTAIWTPPSAGAYSIVGQIEYDGFRTPESEGRVEVGLATAALPWLLIGLVGGLLVLLVAGVAIARRRGARPPARRRP